MKIRDLREYVKSISGSFDIDKLGTDNEPFFEKVYGAGRQVDKMINSVADFASNSEEQLFYEFVQNAYDAKTDSLFFFANEKYLIVLNNGIPFYTDADIHKNSGELFSFLAKGASDKGEGSLGYYGQGSKLLYTLITDSSLANTRDLLHKSIYLEKKGPYVISWNDAVQLNNLLLDREEWEPADFEDIEENILICKIINSYFPVIPGISSDYFSNSEYHEVLAAFNQLVDPRRNLNRLKQGTAIIIPLGKGQYEKILKESNLTKVKTRLGGFSSITSDKEYNKGKHINNIFVFGEAIEQHDVKSIILETNIEGETLKYHFAFNPVFAEEGYVNLFKGLPILEAKYNLGFIIDSQSFELDNSRQRIINQEKTKAQLAEAFSVLLNRIVALKKSSKETFDYIYKALLVTNIPEGEDYDFVRVPFEQVFLPFFKENVLTDKGTYVKLENARKGKYSEIIPLQEIGITTYSWAEESIIKSYKDHHVYIERYELKDVLSDANTNQLTSYFKGLSTEGYEVFTKLLWNESLDNLAIFKIFRSNKGNMFSLNELQSDTNVYFYTKDTAKLIQAYRAFTDLEYIPTAVNIDNSILWNKLLEKIKAYPHSFNVSDAGKECACTILKYYLEANPSSISVVRNIELLPNMMDVRMPFKQILNARPNGTTILDNFLLKGYRPECLDSSWLCTKKKDIWNLLIEKFEEIKKDKGWQTDSKIYLKDIKSLYNQLEDKQNAGTITLYLNADGMPTNTVQRYLRDERLSEAEYNLITKHFKDTIFVPYKFKDDLRVSPFNLTGISLNEMITNGEKVDQTLLTLFFKVDKYFLDKFYIQETGGMFAIYHLGSGKNYLSTEIDNEQEVAKMLEKYNYHQIPENIFGLISKDLVKRYKFTENTELVNAAMSACEPKYLLFPIIKKCNDDVKRRYFNFTLSELNIYRTINDKDIIWQIIQYAAKYDDYKDNVFNVLQYKDETLPDTIKPSTIMCRGKEFNLYDLIPEYKADNETIDKFLALLPDGKWFKDEYYKDKQEEISAEEVYDDYIEEDDLSLKEIEFALDYLYDNGKDIEYLHTVDESVSLKEVLSLISNNDYPNVDNYLAIEGFDKEKQICAPDDVLLQEERMPKDIVKWLTDDPGSHGKITGYMDENTPLVRLRRALLNNEAFFDPLVLIGQNSDLLKNTIQWIVKKTKDFTYLSENFSTINRLLEDLPESLEKANIPVMTFTGALSETDKMPLMKVRLYSDSLQFINVDNNEFIAYLGNHPKLRKFVQDHLVCYYRTTEWLDNHDIKITKKTWSVFNSADVSGNYKEWDDPVYLKWKEQENITVNTSANAIGTNFQIRCNKQVIYSEQIHEEEFGYDSLQRMVVVHYPNKDKKKILALLAEVSKHAEFFKIPYIQLQQMFLEQFGELQDIAEKEGVDIQSVVRTAIKQAQADTDTSAESGNGTSEGKGNTSLDIDDATRDKLEENIESIKDILDGYSEEELKKLAEDPENIKRKMEEIEEEEDPESQVRQTIGYIGELIYRNYLKDKLKKDIEFSADEGEGAYDFKYDNVYVDVKTNLYSFRDKTVPFYMHISQSKFLQEHPESQYRIVRISLKDLALEQDYITLRSRYGVDQNPRQNERLKKDCEKIATKYWRKARIEEFNELSPEYSIKLEIKNRKHE